ncbi:MAG: EscU/YscU/HrcU family type III secretion system export apparatus switch protein [Myxococcaceae bacterium]|nr:EscU/YscU/HrcU family type III secretion system export apparatus switch protein [Myxococcaceae bacterium]
MADTESDAEKTEFISTRREQEAWDQGRIPVGRDTAGVAAMMAGLVSLMVLAPRLRDALVTLTRESLQSVDRPLAGLVRFFYAPFGLALLVLAVAAVAATAVTAAQTRGRFWPELALPDFERMTGNKLFRAFSKEFLADMGLLFLKVVAVVAVIASAVKEDLWSLPRLLTASPEVQLAAVFRPMTQVAVRVVAVMGVFAAAELGLSHWRFREKLKMTKEEAKRELKEDEGDPMLKGRRKRRARELVKGRIAVDVPRADAVVVNPTHIAVAIRYRKDEGAAPRVIAKGKGQTAETIRELARANGIPIVEDIMLARLLFKRVKVGKAIPAETYRAVAAILAFVYRVTGRKPGAASAAPLKPRPAAVSERSGP